jgi:hypothetical protein
MSTRETQIDCLFDPDVVQQPHDYYQDLRENDPVHDVPGTGTFLVTRMDLIHDIVVRTDVFSSVSAEFLHKGDWPTPGLRPAVSGYTSDMGGGVLATVDPPPITSGSAKWSPGNSRPPACALWSQSSRRWLATLCRRSGRTAVSSG